MGVVCGHLNDLLLKQTSVGNLAVSRPPSHRATRGCGRANPRVSRLWVPVAATRATFDCLMRAIFAEAIIVRQCANAARLFGFDFLPMGNKLRELKTLQ